MAARSNQMQCRRHLFSWKVITLCLLSWRTLARQWSMLLAVKWKSVATWRCWTPSHSRLFLSRSQYLHIQRALSGQLWCSCFDQYFHAFILFILKDIFSSLSLGSSWPIATDLVVWFMHLSVCQCVCWTNRWVLQKHWTDGDAIWGADTSGPKELWCIRWGVHIGATWHIQWIDLCSSSDAACCCHYCGNWLSSSTTTTSGLTVISREPGLAGYHCSILPLLPEENFRLRWPRLFQLSVWKQ